MTKRRIVLQSMAAGAASLALPSLHAQDNAPITMLVGAASSMDFTARLVADHLRDALGRPVVVLSKLGAGGRLALNELKRAAPDGRTLMFSTSSLFAIYPHSYTRLDYDPVADFTPVSSVAWFDLGLAAGPMSGAADIKQLLEWWRRQGPNPLYGNAPGAGSSSHFTGIALALASGLQLKPVHYKDSGVGVVDLAAGRLPMLITGTKPLVELHKSGKIKLLAVSGEKRQPLVPEVPTLQESGINVVIQNSAAVYGPAKLPREIVDRIHTALAPMLGKPDALAKLADQGMVPFPMNGTQVASYLVEERKRFERLARESGYVPETL